MKLKHIFITLSLTGVAGCSLLGPDYTRPNVDAPNKFTHQGNQAILESSSLMSDTAWWQQFNDPTLNEMIDIALKNNNNIQVAIGNIAEARAQLERAQMAWVPTIGLQGGGFVGQQFNSSTPPNSTNFNGSYAALTPMYSLNIFRIIKTQDMAKLNIKMQQASKNAVRLAVISQVANTYFNLLGLKEKLELQEQVINDLVEMKKYNEIKVKNGTATNLNVYFMDQFIAAMRAQVPMIRNGIVQAENALQVLMNKNPETIITKNTFANIKTDNVIPLYLPSEVLQNRPDVIAAEYGVETSNAKIGVSTSQFFPSINLVSPLGASSTELGNLFSGSSDFWMTQISASVPLLNLGILADIKQSKANYYSSYYNYIQTVRQAFSDVDTGLSNHTETDNTYNEHTKSLDAAKKSYNLSMIGYKNGSIAYADTVGLKMNVDYSKLTINTAKMNQLSSIVGLYQALGGGYNYTNTESMNKFGDSHDID